MGENVMKTVPLTTVQFPHVVVHQVCNFKIQEGIFPSWLFKFKSLIMKFSQFNIFFEYNNLYIGFNTYNNEIITLDSFLFELIKTNDDVEELRKIHPDFYHFLIDKNFIIKSELKEINQVKQLMQKIDNSDSSYQLILNPTMNCNFKCWYCYEDHLNSSRMSLEIQKAILNHAEIICSVPTIKEFHLSWFGGEPLLEFENIIVNLTERLKEIIKQKEISLTTSYTTNGLLINQEMISFFKKTNTINFQITLDGHKDKHDKVRFISKKKGSYDKIVENIKLLASNKLNVTVRINYSEETLHSLKKIADDFIEFPKSYLTYLEFSFNQVWQVDKDLEREMKLVRGYFSTLGLNVRSVYNIDSVKNSCYADKKNQATINYDGFVYKCTARNFSKENREGQLNKNGTILWNKAYERRMNIKLNNKACHTCSILPICGGGCSQVNMEMLDKNSEYCLFEYNENKKINFIKNKIISTC